MNEALPPVFAEADPLAPAARRVPDGVRSLPDEWVADRAGASGASGGAGPEDVAPAASGADEPDDTLGQALAGIRILAVDDSLDVLESFSTLLRLEGAEVTAVASAAAALTAVDGAAFDLLLSDVTMPGMDGHALIAALRERPDTARLPAIALTGFGRSQDARQALDAGFDAHIKKPVQVDRLLEMVAGLLDGGPGGCPRRGEETARRRDSAGVRVG